MTSRTRLSLFRLLLCALALLLGWADTAIAETTLWVTSDQVQISRFGEGYRIEIGMLAPVPLAIAWQVLTDFSGMARFIPNLDSSRIVSQDGGGKLRIEQRGNAHFGPFSQKFVSVRDIEMQAMREIHARQISGTARSMESRMQLTALGAQQTRLDYRADIVAEVVLPPLIGPSFLKHEMAEQFSASIAEMQRRHSSAAAPGPGR